MIRPTLKFILADALPLGVNLIWSASQSHETYTSSLRFSPQVQVAYSVNLQALFLNPSCLIEKHIEDLTLIVQGVLTPRLGTF